MHEGRCGAQGNITEPRNRHQPSLPIVDEVGYIPFDQDDANLFVQLVSSLYEHTSLIVTSTCPSPAGETSSAT
jgi:DNA replication protein DnaC